MMKSPILVLAATLVAFCAATNPPASARDVVSRPFDPARGLVLRGTVVTMDDRHSVIENGRVLVRNDRIVAVWRGERPPSGIDVGEAVTVDLGPSALIFPGMINLHNHPTYSMLRMWPAPSSDVQANLGRPF